MQYIDVQKNIDESKFNFFNFKVLFWCFLIILIDGYDVAIAGVAIPSIMENMGVSAVTAGFMASSALFGMMFGGIFMGSISEKIGRRWSLSICIFLFSVFTAAAGMCDDPYTFSLMRFLAGIGIGGVQPNITAHMTEYAPKKIRSMMTAIMFSGYALGAVCAAVLGKQFILQFGWQVVFYAAALPVILIPFIIKFMPDSMLYMQKKNDRKSLEKALVAINPKLDLSKPYTLKLTEKEQTSSAPVIQLFQNGRALSTVMFWISITTGLFMVYALSTWLTKLMAMSGYSLGSSLSFVIALNIGAIFGSIFCGWLADRFQIKWVVVSMFAFGSIFLYMMTLNLPTHLLYILIALVGSCTTGAQIIAYAFCGQFYPSHIRSTGIGFATGIGRLGAILAPVIIGIIVNLQLPLEQNFMVIALAGLIGTIALCFIMPQQKTALKTAAV